MLMLNQNPIAATLSHHGSFGGVVQARYVSGDSPLCFVAYATVDDDFVITSFDVNPRATAKEAQLAGDKIDIVLEAEAMKLGIKRLLIIHPGRSAAEFVREYRPQPFTLGRISHRTNPITYLN